MFSFKKVLSLALCMGSLASTAAIATGLTIDNQTNEYSTAVINNGACSNKLPGGAGITQPHSVNTINERLIRLACLIDLHNCKADIYMTNNCTGPVVAKATFDVDRGITSFNSLDNRFSVMIDGFKATIKYAS